jgi:hypothetical protein
VQQSPHPVQVNFKPSLYQGWEFRFFDIAIRPDLP